MKILPAAWSYAAAHVNPFESDPAIALDELSPDAARSIARSAD